MFSSLVKSAIVLSSLATLVSAHGFVHSVILDGKKYTSGLPFTEGGSKTPKSGSPIRTIRNNGPAVPAGGKMVNSAALACGREQISATFTAPVTAGSKVSIDWADWPHNSGPLITYLGACNGDCAKTDPTKVNFFKVHEIGFVSGTKWFQDTELRAKKVPYTFTLPKNVPSGNFIMRHEIIALHLADKLDGAEFYPSCIHVNIKGGTGSIPSQTVKFPGGYKNTDAGIRFSVFNGNAALAKYKIPGPPIALGGSGVSANSTEGTTGDDTTGDDSTGSDDTTGGDDNSTGDDTTGDDTTGDDETDDDDTTGDDTTGDDTTGDDNTGGDDSTGDDYTGDDGADTGDDNGDDSGCTGDDAEEEDTGNTDEPSTSSVVATETATSTPQETSKGSSGGKGGKSNGKGHGHRHNHRSDEVKAGSPRMVRRHRMHLAIDLAKQMPQ